MKTRALTLALIAWACLSAPALAAWSVTGLGANGNANNINTTSITTGSITIPANAVAFFGGVVRRNSGTPVVGVADSGGNSYTVVQCTSTEAFAPWVSFIAYFRYQGTGLTSGTVTMTDSVGGNFTGAAMSGTYATGGQLTPVEDSAGRGCPGTPASSSTSPTVTSGAPTASGNLAFGVTARPSGGTTGFSYTADSGHGWTAAGATGNGSVAEGTAYAINSGSSAIVLNPTMNNQQWTQQIMQFFVDVPAAGGTSKRGALLGVGR